MSSKKDISESTGEKQLLWVESGLWLKTIDQLPTLILTPYSTKDA